MVVVRVRRVNPTLRGLDAVVAGAQRCRETARLEDCLGMPVAYR
jgi:hypothetical protein